MMKAKTINDAIIEILKKERKPLSIKDIHAKIVENELYDFKTSNPEHIIRNQLRRHSENVNLKISSKMKLYIYQSDQKYSLK